MFADALQTVLADCCPLQVVRAIEAGGSTAPLADVLAAAGFQDLLAPEADGGTAAAWPDFHALVVLCGAFALPLPLPQTMAARALVRTQEQLPPGLITLAPAIARTADGALHADLVPFGRTATHVIGALGDALALLPVRGALHQAPGVHGSLAGSLRWEAGAATLLESAVSPRRLQALGAAIHAALMAGAMQRVFELTVDYASQRVQFGQPIAGFQAIQHQLSVAAEHVVAASMAAEAAFQTSDGPLPSFAACAVAKSRASEAAQLVASTAHAVHGAIGVTQEYDLQLFTRRLHEWRLAHGSESHWNRELGRLCLEDGEKLFADTARQLLA